MASARSAAASQRRRASGIALEVSLHIILLLLALLFLMALTEYYWVAFLHSEGGPLPPPDPVWEAWARERAAFYHGWFNVVRVAYLVLLIKSAYSLIRWYWRRRQHVGSPSTPA